MSEERTASVTIQDGELKGSHELTAGGQRYYAFRGIPYARPPVGPLRFEPPQSVEKWNGIRDATSEGSVAPQINLFSRQFEGEEDCLFLNVYTPQLPLDGQLSDPLSVLVWIHGGGFFLGSGNDDLHGPDYLVERDLVVVTLNYRLGVLGFMSTGDRVVPGNMGLKDQVMALRWVKENISSFGGDPSNVTISGISAGSISCQALILSPLGKGLFHKAILQSGVLASDEFFSTKVVNRTFLLAEKLGLRSKNSEEVVAFLREVAPRTLVERMYESLLEEDKQRKVIFPFVPTLEPSSADGWSLLSEHPLDILKSGNYNHVPLIMGVTSREGINFVQELEGRDMETFNENFHYLLPSDLPITKDEKISVAEDVRKFYFGERSLVEETLTHYVDLKGDLMFYHPVIRAAKMHASHSAPPVFFYVFSADGEYNFGKKESIKRQFSGSAHGDDLLYLFRAHKDHVIKMNAAPGTIELSTASRMTKLWSNFAKTGNPTAEQDELVDVQWPAFTQLNPCYLLIVNKGLTVATDLFKDRILFWDRLYSRIIK